LDETGDEPAYDQAGIFKVFAGPDDIGIPSQANRLRWKREEKGDVGIRQRRQRAEPLNEIFQC
jgi:hypothetical protein